MNGAHLGGVLALAALGASTGTAAMGATLVAQYTFNEGEGTTVHDTSGNGTAADGTIKISSAQGAVAASLSSHPGYIDFGTGGGYVNYGHPSKLNDFTNDFQNGWSIVAWVKDIGTTGAFHNPLVFGTAPGEFGSSFYYDSNNPLRFFTYYGIKDGSTQHAWIGTPDDNTGEHMYVFTYNPTNGQYREFRDYDAWTRGVNNPSPYPTLPDISGKDFITGVYSPSINQFLTGLVDEIGYYDGALSQAEIKSLYDAGPVPVPEPAGGALMLLGLVPLATRRRRCVG